MRGLFELGRRLQDFLEARSWKFCFIGGVALQRWGIPRLTRDLDLSLFTGFGGEEAFIRELLAEFPGRSSQGLAGAFRKGEVADAAEFALRYRVLLLQSQEEIGIDIALAGFPFEEEIIGRASPFGFLPGLALRTCSAEDLVVLKAFASRTQDWADIEGILARSGKSLNLAAVEERLRPLCEIKEVPEILPRLLALTANLR